MAKSPCNFILNGITYTEDEFKAALAKELPEQLEKMPELKKKFEELEAKVKDQEKELTTVEKKEQAAKFRDEVLKITPKTPREAIMLYFAGGGRITTENFKKNIFNPARSAKEFSKRIWAHAKESFQMRHGKSKTPGKMVEVKSIDDLAMSISEYWENAEGKALDTQELSNEIHSVLNDFESRQDIIEALRKEHAGDEGKILDAEQLAADQQRKYEEAQGEAIQELKPEEAEEINNDEHAQEMLREVAQIELSPQEIDEVHKFFDNFTDEKGNIDWEKAAENVSTVFDPPFKDLNERVSNEVQKIISDATERQRLEGEKREKATGAGSSEEVPKGKTREELEKEVKEKKAVSDKATADYEAGKASLDKNLNNKQQDIFAKGKTGEGMFGDDTAEKTKAVKELKDKADAAKAEYDKAQNLLDENLKGQQDLFDDNNLKDLPPPTDLGFTGEELTKAIDALTKLGKSLIKKGAATTKNVWDKIKEYLADKFPSWVKGADKMKDDVLKGINEPEPVNVAEMLLKGATDEEIDKELQKRKEAISSIQEVLKNQKKSTSLTQQIKNSKMVASAKKAVQTLAPFSFDPQGLSLDAAAIIRKNVGERERAISQIDEANKRLLQFWNKIPRAEKLGFILSIENPEKYGEASPEFKAMAETYRERMDKVFDMIANIKDVPYLEDYFPHFWEKPDEAKTHFEKINAKKPLEGNKSFLKKRFYGDILEGLKDGFELTTENPEELVRLAEMNAYKFKTAHDIFNDMKDKGMLKYAKPGDQPEGWAGVDDPIFKRLGLFVTEEGDPKLSMGNYYMPEPVARIVNNYLSVGLGEPARMIRSWNNIKNLFQLGFGLFHFTTTSIDATVTGVGNALQEISGGKVLTGTKDLVQSMTIAPNLIKTVLRGDKVIKQWKTSGLNADVDALTKVNGNTGLSKIYSTDSGYQLQKAFNLMRADKDISQLPNIIKNTLLVLPELAGKPLMEWYVPRLKVGGYLNSLDKELQLRPNMTESEKNNARMRAWDNMDDRLGQVVYDNIFWKKSIKDLAFLAIRSQGWTIGTIKAIGGGIADIPKSAARLSRGEGITQRTAWAIALPITVGTMGGLYQYITTGKKPKDLQDYFFPLDGTTNPDGTPHRISFPSYMKDVLNYKDHPFQTLARKTSPVINELYEIYNNKDFYGTQVYNSEDPFYQKGIDILKYEEHTFEPFSFKQKPGEDKSLLDQLTTQQGLEQKFGLMPAPKDFERSKMENQIVAESAKNFGEKSYTKEEQEQKAARKQVREMIYAGHGRGEIPKEIKDNAAIKEEGLNTFLSEAKLNPYERMFKHLRTEQKVKLFDKMSDDEKKVYKKYMPGEKQTVYTQKEKDLAKRVKVLDAKHDKSEEEIKELEELKQQQSEAKGEMGDKAKGVYKKYLTGLNKQESIDKLDELEEQKVITKPVKKQLLNQIESEE